MLCLNCKTDSLPVLSRNGPHIMATCSECGRYIKFLAQKKDGDFVMPFGKHKGKKLEDIDAGYLQILHDHVRISGRIKGLIEERLKKDI